VRRRGQLDAFLDVELVLAKTDAKTVDAQPTQLERPTPRPSASSLGAGTQIGKYQLLQLLGSGGMGAVWEARDVDLGRRVAIKVLHPDHAADGHARGRLMREARAMARLHHPNVITVYDAATFDGRDIIAMELVRGETLASWLSRPHPMRERVSALLAAGRGLAAAHAAGLVHRDFKPHNVLVDKRGRVLVTDFGLARAVADAPGSSADLRVEDVTATLPEPPPSTSLAALDGSLTLTGMVLGTPAYMAPEQFSGGVADEKSDQFSYCVTLWEAVAGKRPFPGDTMPQIAAAVHQGADPERMPRTLRSIVMRGLAVDRDRRWPSMNALLAAAERALRRRRIALAVTIAVIVAAAATVAFVLLAERQTWRPQIVDLPSYEENSNGVTISPDGKSFAYDSDREQTDVFRIYVQPLAGGEPRAVTPANESFMAPRWTRDGKAVLLTQWQPARTHYRIVRQPVDGGPAVDLGLGFHADDCGDGVLIADNDRSSGQLVLVSPDGSRRVLLQGGNDFIVSPRCDASGQRILYLRGSTLSQNPPSGDLCIFDRTTGRDTQITRGRKSASGMFTPDGRSVVFSARDGDKVQLFEVAAAGGEPRRLTVGSPDMAPEITPDGRTLIFDRDRTARIAVIGGQGLRKLSARHETLLSMVPTSDGKLVAERLGEHGAEIIVISETDGGERLLVEGAHPFLSRDARRVFFTPSTKPDRLSAIPIGGGPIESVAELPGALLAGADASDGIHIELWRNNQSEWYRIAQDRRLASDSAHGLVFEARSGGWRAVRTLSDSYHYRFVAPDGSGEHEVKAEAALPTWLDAHRFAYASAGRFHIIDVTTGAEVGSLPGPTWGEHAILAADGTRWYDLQVVAHVTRHWIVNFADRPR